LLPPASTRLADGAKAGTFVELKNADIGAGTGPHLSYVGDAARWKRRSRRQHDHRQHDGVDKHRPASATACTSIHTSLVAPVDAGAGGDETESDRHPRLHPAGS
jgi:bifunctional UDP-N-acetylglucosamine pyrophosphorylase/glucosamine-1-phosphate N-acetyltransferase